MSRNVTPCAKKGDVKLDLGYAELVTEKTKWSSSVIKAQIRGGQNFKNERDGWLT